jgi:LemA protein
VIWVVVGIAVIVLLIATFLVVLYNRLVRLRNRAENAWAQVDVQLRRRYDLIPNLVETVKGYASHERATFEEVTKARTAAQQARTVPEQAEAENFLTAAIGRLFAVAEDYPELRASENFQQLQAQLEDTEQKIAISRQVYNDAVLTYDTALETVPTNIVGGMFNFEEKPYFEIEEPAAREAPRVRSEGAPAPRSRSRLHSRTRRNGGGEVVRVARGERRGAGRARRVLERRGNDHVPLRGLVQRSLP